MKQMLKIMVFSFSTPILAPILIYLCFKYCRRLVSTSASVSPLVVSSSPLLLTSKVMYGSFASIFYLCLSFSPYDVNYVYAHTQAHAQVFIIDPHSRCSRPHTQGEEITARVQNTWLPLATVMRPKLAPG